MRPQNWIKNLLIFIPIFFANHIFETDRLLNSTIYFLIFCLTASSIYLLNDICDLKNDKLHESKKHRALASGKISVLEAVFLFFLLLGSAFILYFQSYQNYEAFYVLLVYIFLNLAYSLYLKHIGVLDIITVSSFYLLRVIGGGIISESIASNWLILSVIFISLFIITAKRKSELNYQTEKRKVLEHYSDSYLNNLQNITLGLALITYSLYTAQTAYSNLAIYSIFFALAGTFRYLAIVEKTGKGENPETLIYKDKFIFVTIVLWVIYMYFIIY